MSDPHMATVTLQLSKGREEGSLKLQQSGTGNVLLRFEALLMAAGQLLATAMREAVPNPEKVSDEMVTETLSAYVAGTLEPLAEQMVMQALSALTPADQTG